MDELAEELYRSLELRLDYLEDYLREVRGELGAGRQGVRDAIRLAEFYPDWVRRFARRQWNRLPSAQDRVQTARSLLTLVRRKAAFFEAWFSRARSLRVPLSLIRAVERSCDELGLGRRKAVLAVGPPGNYETFVADLKSYLFSGIQPAPPLPRDVPQDLRKSRFALMLIPRFEGGEALWRPVVLGHELAHLRVRAKDVVTKFNVRGRLDWTQFPAALPHFPRWLGLTPRLAIEQIADHWVEELICDAYAARRFGPAGVASLSEFLDVVGAIDEISPSHPPGWLRVRLLTRWIGEPVSQRLKRVIAPWAALAASTRPTFEPWAGALVDQLEALADDYMASLADWPPAYDADGRSPLIERAAEALKDGLPPTTVCQGDPRRQPYAQDVMNAGWVGRVDGHGTPVAKLVSKSLDDVEFLRLWRAAEGRAVEVPKPEKELSVGGTLSAPEINRRLRAEDEKRLVITPLLEPALGNAAVDVRLGSSFITFRRTGTASFDPLSAVHDPRTMQEDVEKDWGEAFILHPGELVLASTLEYLWLPSDLSAQVITRSSYGRLGLITATAIQVHPHYKGCLTLELMNLGEVPLELTPGERIAQLVFSKVDPPADPMDSKYSYPVKPEFSKVRTDDEAVVLRRLQESARHRYGI